MSEWSSGQKRAVAVVAALAAVIGVQDYRNREVPASSNDWVTAGVAPVDNDGALISESQVAGNQGPAPEIAPENLSDGWRRVVDDQFNVGGVPAHWKSYSGKYTAEGGNCVSPSHATVSGGNLNMLLSYDNSGVNAGAHCTGPQWYSSGLTINDPALEAQNERITMRWRIINSGIAAAYVMPELYNADYDPKHKTFATTWPAVEDDDLESDSGSTTAASMNIHHNAGSLSRPINKQVRLEVPGPLNLAQWTTIRVQRLGQRFTMWINNMKTPVIDETLSTTDAIPAVGRVILQQECPSSGCRGDHGATSLFEIDKIAIDVQ